jgi:hypothetical protein
MEKSDFSGYLEFFIPIRRTMLTIKTILTASVLSLICDFNKTVNKNGGTETYIVDATAVVYRVIVLPSDNSPPGNL